MALNVWRFITIMLAAVTMAAALAHALELPPKMEYEARQYVLLHRTLYTYYGRIAGVAEILAVIAAVGLAWGVRKDRRSFGPTLIGAILLVLTHVVFWVWVQPANATMLQWTLEEIPADWLRWRDQWEYAHAARALLTLAALGALNVAVLRETRDRAAEVERHA